MKKLFLIIVSLALPPASALAAVMTPLRINDLA
jgi:hypothetical protein